MEYKVNKESVNKFFPKKELDFSHYESPIEVIVGQLRMEQEKKLEGDIFRAVQDYGITVEKEELIKALQYDRQQYEKGYKYGYEDGVTYGVRKMMERLHSTMCDIPTKYCERTDYSLSYRFGDWVDDIAKEILEGNNEVQ
jgi:flagellar biosynthesis/type III secretory pathway protein FliH